MTRLLLTTALLALASCTASHDVPAALSQPADSAIAQQARVAALLETGKLKVKGGTVIIQLGGTGNTASPADNRKAGQRQGSAATAPASTAGNASKRTGGGVSPWWFVLAAVGGVALWEWASHQGLLGWLPWRARVG